MKISELKKVDGRNPNLLSGEIACFVAVRNEISKVPYFIEYYRNLGVSRFYFVDNNSDDETLEFLMKESDCHCFETKGRYYEENIAPPCWTNALANTYGSNRWCLTVDVDELLIYPNYKEVKLSNLCTSLDMEGAESLFCPMIDMYGDLPILQATYTSNQPFLAACSYHEKEIGQARPFPGGCPSVQILGGVRERVFWKGSIRHQLPPCISKLPLIKWRRGMHYLHSMHFHSGAKLSKSQAALLHFKFLDAPVKRLGENIKENSDSDEKTITEYKSMISVISKQRDLRLYNKGKSVKFDDEKIFEFYSNLF